MKKSWLSWFGLLGLLGLLAPATGIWGFAGFFGFFAFFSFASITSDERLEATTLLAARDAFLSGMVAFIVVTLLVAAIPDTMQQFTDYAYAVCFAVQMLVFTVSLVGRDRGGA